MKLLVALLNTILLLGTRIASTQGACDGCCKCTKLGGTLGKNYENVIDFKGSEKGTQGYKDYRKAEMNCKRQCISRTKNNPFPNLDGRIKPLTPNECIVYCRRASNLRKKTNRRYCEQKNFCKKPVYDLLPKVAEDDGYTTFMAAITAADFVDELSRTDVKRTVFAPSNEAFENLADGILECLLKPENKDDLRDILNFHIAEQRYNSVQLEAKADEAITSLEGQGLFIQVDEVDDVTTITVAGDPIVDANKRASNGMLHGMGAVMIPIDVDLESLCATAAPTISPAPVTAPPTFPPVDGFGYGCFNPAASRCSCGPDVCNPTKCTEQGLIWLDYNPNNEVQIECGEDSRCKPDEFCLEEDPYKHGCFDGGRCFCSESQCNPELCAKKNKNGSTTYKWITQLQGYPGTEADGCSAGGCRPQDYCFKGFQGPAPTRDPAAPTEEPTLSPTASPWPPPFAGLACRGGGVCFLDENVNDRENCFDCSVSSAGQCTALGGTEFVRSTSSDLAQRCKYPATQPFFFGAGCYKTPSCGCKSNECNPTKCKAVGKAWISPCATAEGIPPSDQWRDSCPNLNSQFDGSTRGGCSDRTMCQPDEFCYTEEEEVPTVDSFSLR